MGPLNSKSNNQYEDLLKRYKVIKKVPSQNLSYLESLSSEGKDCVCKEFTNLDEKEHQKKIVKIEEHKKIWDHTHLVKLTEYLTTTENQYCSSTFKVYALFEYPHRTLNEEIIERSTQRQKFQEKELWSIIASCILGMSHLQKHNIRHMCLSSESILVDSNGVIKIADPFCAEELPNYDKLLNRRNSEHIYLSPELCESLERAEVTPSPDINPYKSDVFTFGMIILEAALLKYQDDCYREENTKVNWETVRFNLEQIGQIYNVEMKEMIKKLVSEVKERPDWLELKQFMKDEGEEKKEDKVNYQEVPPVKQKTVNITHLAPRPQTHLNFVPQNVVQPPLNYPLTRPISQAVPVNQIVHQHVAQIIPVQPSNLNFVRPSLGTRPADSFITKTRIDQNLIEVSDDQDDIQTNEGDVFHDNSARHQYAPSYPISVPVHNTSPISGNYVQKLNPHTDSTNTNNVDRNRYAGSGPTHINVGAPVSVPPREIYPPPNNISGQRYVNNISGHVTYQVGPPQHSFNSNVNRSNNSSIQGPNFTGSNIPNPIKLTDNSNLFTDFSKLGINRSNYDISSNTSPTHNYAQSQYSKVEDVKPVGHGSRPVSVHKEVRNVAPPAPAAVFEVVRVVETFSQGSRYQGEKVNGMRHGKGKFYYQDGGLYDGEWKENKMCGKGKLFYQSGKIAYEGDWDNDTFTGYGILYNEYPQSLNAPYNFEDFDNMEEVWTKFEGNFVKDMKQGLGKLFFSNGEYYEGNFDGDVVNGRGLYHTMSGEGVGGVWQENHLVKRVG